MKMSGPLLILVATLLANTALASGVTLPSAERVVLPNGVVIVLNEKHDVPLIGLEIIVRGGASRDPVGKYGLATTLAELLLKGAGERSAAEFAETVAAVGGDLSATADLESLRISADFMAGDAELMVGLVADLLLHPTLARAEFEKLRTRSINLIKAAKGANPGRLMPAYANAFLYGAHPYGNPVDGSESSLAAIGHDDVLAYYRDQVGADRLVIAVSGDFDTAALLAVLAAAFSDWRAAAQPLADVPALLPGATMNRVLLIDKPGATQSYFYIGGIGVARNFAQRADLDLANTVFGGRFTSMLMTELRTNSGLSYSASSRLSRYTVSGSVFIRSFTETSTTVEALDVALGVLRRLRDDGLSEAMLTSARNYILGQFAPTLETAAQLAGVFAMLEAYGLGTSYIDHYGDALGESSVASIAAVIQDVYPPRDALLFVVLGDADSLRKSLAAYGDLTEMTLSAPRFRP